MLTKVLQKIGLNSNEAKVYLATLKLGTQDIKTISKDTGLSTSDAMLILSSLMERGFISRYAREKDFFTAEHPEVLLKILENSKYKLEENIKSFSDNLHKFSDYMNPALSKPEIAFYEGKEGIIAAFEDTLTSKSDILAIAAIDETEGEFPDYMNQYYQRRKAAGILIKAIFPESKMSKARQKKDESELRVSRLVPRDKYEFNNIELNIYDDKVAYFSVEEKLAVIVKSKDISESMRNMFQMCWDYAELLEENKQLKKKAK